MKILSEIPSFSETELYVYKYIIANPRRVVRMSIMELAAQANTSTATVLRMCHKYGCSGFSQFKFKLQEELNNPNVETESMLDISYHNVAHFINTTAKSREFNASMEKAAELLSDKHFILFVGAGSSNIISEYGTLYFSYLFNMSFRVEDLSNYPIDYYPRELAKNICMIVCSVSGDTEEVVQYVKNYHTGNTPMITITANNKSILAELADVAITYTMPITMSGQSNLTSQVPAVYIIETLAAMVKKLREEKKAKE